MTHPYAGLGQEAFWKTAVADPGMHGLSGLWVPKFPIKPRHRIVTAGSCFAQHIGRALAARGYQWIDAEPAPPFLFDEHARRFNYGVFSFRTGNIYTARMLNQWIDLALGTHEFDEVWERDGRYFDPLRPAIEPDGFADEAELHSARAVTRKAFLRAIRRAHVFVFTLGLTESWRNRDTKLEYALCPGTVAGEFDPERHAFHNQTPAKVLRAMRRAIAKLKRINPRLRILLTVSPVPLTATASGQHVLTATSHSKAVLRATAGQLAQELDFVDYFPSYEIITHPVFRGMFFAPNQRSVEQAGVETVMRHFFADQAAVFGQARVKPEGGVGEAGAGGDVKCEEELLSAFA